MRSAICFTLRTMSSHPRAHRASEENSCSTFSILIDVIAAPCSDDNSTRRKGIAKRKAKAPLERLRDKGHPAAAIAAVLDFQIVGFLEFLPVLGVDGHEIPLGFVRRDGCQAMIATDPFE
jgi:hypothetical protein